MQLHAAKQTPLIGLLRLPRCVTAALKIRRVAVADAKFLP